MCGIVGARHDWLVANGRDPESTMRAAVASLAWRGPDGQGVARAGAWWLGCARLAIGPANSRQPLARRGGRFVGVMNGAITNARELFARALPGAERRPQLPNDAWLPLLAVERNDPAALHELRGHHAFAVADAHTGELVFARDRHGEKPFFCLVERDGPAWRLVAFASSEATLHELGMPRDIAPRRIAEWFRFGWHREAPLRFHRRAKLVALDVHGPSVTTTDGARWLRPWHDAPPQRATPRRGVRDELIAAVTRCTDTPVPVALSLSGGVDSSCLAFALAAAGRRVAAYQLRAAGAPPDERHSAAAVARAAGLELRPIDVGPAVLDALPHLTACAARPLGDPSILAMHALARSAAADGHRVLLSGEGADELFFGYRRHRAIAATDRLRWLRPFARFADRWSMRHPARLLRAATANDPLTALLAVTPPAFADHVLAPELTRRRCWRDDGDVARRDADPLLAARTHDLANYLRCDLLPKADIACLAAGVEGRCPFLEADFALEDDLRDARSRRAALGKRRLREAFAAELPAAVLRLPKTGFALPLDRWFRGELPWLDVLAESRTQQRPHLRPGGIARAIDVHRRGRADLGHGLYLLVAFELFLRHAEDSPAGQPKSAPLA